LTLPQGWYFAYFVGSAQVKEDDRKGHCPSPTDCILILSHHCRGGPLALPQPYGIKAVAGEQNMLPNRKSTRIPNYDYASRNYYFVTICTDGKRCIFGFPGKLNQFGNIAKDCLIRIPEIYPGIQLDKFVVMPNHIHGILVIGTEDSVNALRRPGNLGVNEMNEIIAYEAYTNPVDVTEFSAEDCKIVRNKWRKSLVGDETTNDLTNKDIAKKLYISEHTIKKHITNILNKLDMRNRKDLIIYTKGNLSKDTKLQSPI
jgi:hypothetical protein